jgi:DGQHR domain-containing protein
MSGKELWKYVEINQRDSDKDKGYQRVLSPSRVNKIATFIDSGKIIPTSIIISLKEGKLKNGKLVFPAKSNAGWVIDGQHRLAGANKAVSEIVFPVVAFVGLTETDQIDQFVTINKEQKGVSSSLYLDLLSKIPGNKSHKDLLNQRAADLATNFVNRDENSPFFGRIVSTRSPKNGEVSLTNWVRKITPHLEEKSGRLYRFDDEKRGKIISNLYQALSIVFAKEYSKTDSVFFKTVGFGGLFNCFPTIYDHTVSTFAGFTIEHVVGTLERVNHFDFEAWRQMGTGNAAENAAANDLRDEIIEAFQGDDDVEIEV